MALSQITGKCTLCLILWSHLWSALLPVSLAADADDDRVRYVHNTKVRFFTSPSMVCDHPQLNITLASDVKAISWVFPDGTNVNSASDVNPRLYTFSGPEDGAAASTGPAPAGMELYNLTALEIDEDQFGYYLCVVEFTSSGGNAKPAAVIRWGLNVNGADFSDLLKTYRENAIVGGAAAAVLLILVGGGCLLWNVKYGNRNEEEDEEDLAEDNNVNDMKHDKSGVQVVGSVQRNNEKKFDNAAFNDDVDSEAVVDVHM